MRLFKKSCDPENTEDPRNKAIILTYSQMAETDFLETLTKVSIHTGFTSSKEAYNAAKIYRRVTNKLKELNKEWMILLKNYASLNDDGSFVLDDGKKNSFIIPKEREEEFVMARMEFERTEFALDCHALDFERMNAQGAKLSPKDLDSFGPLFIEPKNERD